MTRLTCVLAVAGLMKSSVAISALERPLRDEREHLALALGQLLDVEADARTDEPGAARTRR